MTVVHNTKIIALIPARAGSKGIAGKNVRKIFGKPLIEFTIQAAKSSKYIDEVCISSDSEEILKLGLSLQCRILKRPDVFADDKASAIDVVRHFLETQNRINPLDELIVYLQPTSPLRTEQHIDQAIELMWSRHSVALVSVVELEKSPYKSFMIDENGKLLSLFDEKLSNARRQDLPVCYVPNGAIYIFSKLDFMRHDGFPSNGSVPYIMSEIDSLDIDIEADILKLEERLREINGRI